MPGAAWYSGKVPYCGEELQTGQRGADGNSRVTVTGGTFVSLEISSLVSH